MSTRRCQAQITVEFHLKQMLCTELLNKTPTFETKIKQFGCIRWSKETNAIFAFLSFFFFCDLKIKLEDHRIKKV